MKTESMIAGKDIIKVMIAEDHVMMRQALAATIRESTENIRVTGLAENGKELLDLVYHEPPDIVILDLTMPVMNGEKVLEILKRDYPAIRTVIYTSDYSDFLVAQAVLNGASAYIDKSKGGADEILMAINRVWEHGYYFHQEAATEIILALHEQKKIYFVIDNKRFSQKEIEIIKQICQNKQIKQIAADLNISQGTVKYHKGKLFEKTDSESTVDLVAYAVRQGIFNPRIS